MPEEVLAYYPQLQSMVLQENQEVLEGWVYELAKQADPVLAEAIKKFDLSGYQIALTEKFEQAIQTIQKNQWAAIYFECDARNDWDSGFYLCETYVPLDRLQEPNRSEDWAAEFVDQLDLAFNILFFSKIYIETSYAPIRLYLMVRTMTVFMKVSSSLAPKDMAICFGFHDDEIILRFQEYEPTEKQLFKKTTAPQPLSVPSSLTPEESYVEWNYRELVYVAPRPCTRKEAIQWVLNNYSASIYFSYCPFCGNLRKTPRATLCLACGKKEEK